ncbi:hypothetical protein [Uruburuella testudinis]|nr:hypothetical protein [Uruburuella testudinis]
MIDLPPDVYATFRPPTGCLHEYQTVSGRLKNQMVLSDGLMFLY